MASEIQKVGGASQEILTDSKMLLESFTEGHLNKISEHIKKLKNTFDGKYDGFAACATKKIKMPYEHIFSMELEWNAKKGTISNINGFHHDFKGYFEKSDLFKIIAKEKKHGCYLADILVDGKIIRDKTFFPKKWAREKVISKIAEAYNNFLKSGATNFTEHGGKYIVEGITNEGIKIRMHITKNGVITSAYPLIKKVKP
jgi:hypothetical protein